MKLVVACFRVRKDREYSLHHCGGPVKLVVACLSAEWSEIVVLSIVESCEACGDM